MALKKVVWVLDLSLQRRELIFKAVFIHSILLACFVGLIVMAYAYLFPSFIP